MIYLLTLYNYNPIENTTIRDFDLVDPDFVRPLRH